jgi:hypothetical protein
MATFSLNDTVRRAISTGNGSTTSFAFSFQINAIADIKVYVDGTLKTQGTGSANYAVQDGSGNAGLTNTGTGAVVFVTAPSNATTITILSDIPLSRTSLYTSGGNVTASSLEDDFDTITMALGDREERDARSIKAPVQDPISIDMTLPAKADRLGKLLGFNSSTGNPEATFTTADGQTLNAIASDIATLADLQDGTTVSNGLSGLAGITGNITTVAGIESDVTTVAGIESDVTAVANVAGAVSSAGANAILAEGYAVKVDGEVESGKYSSKAWAIGGTDITDTAGAGSAKSWAVEADTVDGTEFSAKVYAGSGSTLDVGSAKNWALGGGDSFATSTTVGTTGLYSAKYWAEQSALSKTEFSNIYHGSSATDPTGGTVTAGDLYFNSGSSVLKFYTGSAWNTVEAVDTSNLASNGFAVAMAIAL